MKAHAGEECRFEVHPEYRRVMRCLGCGVLRSARCECDPATGRPAGYCPMHLSDGDPRTPDGWTLRTER